MTGITTSSNTAATTDTPAPQPRRLRYIPALDGIRTLAVLAVILYHLGLPWAPGGFLGVTVFFVLSGYLITRLLLGEFVNTSTINIKDFWVRRLRRLMPACVTVVVATAALCTVFNHVMLTKMRPDIIPSLLFVNNWWQIFSNVSYFNALGDPSPLTHFWSLAIEEQFYLVWPVLLLLLFRRGARRTWVRRSIFGLAVASALLMAVLYNPEADVSRIYYGTDTRAFALLLGAWLAFIPPKVLRKSPLTSKSWHCDLWGAVALVGLAVMCVVTNGYSAAQYRGLMFLSAFLAVVLIASALQHDTRMSQFLALRPLVWLGKRSYSLYLWHYPLLLLMNPVADIEQKPWWLQMFQLLVVLAAAELCYRFIETPLRRGTFMATLHSFGQTKGSVKRFVAAHLPEVAVCTLLSVVALAGIIFVPPTSALTAEEQALLQQHGSESPDTLATNTQAATAATTGAADDFPAGAYDVLFIGDSVGVRTIPYFEKTFPHGHIDSKVNRQFDKGIELFQEYESKNLAGKIAIFELGTNGPVSREQIDHLMSVVGDKRIVVLITTRSPRNWVASTNQVISDAPNHYHNIRVVDWYGYSEGKGNLFSGDGTHLNEDGAQQYTQLIYDAIKDVLPEHPEDVQATTAAATDAATNATTNAATNASTASTTSSTKAASTAATTSADKNKK